MRNVTGRGQISKAYNTSFGNIYMGRNMYKIKLSDSPWSELAKQKIQLGDNIAR
jgi:hypothetical protein